MVVTKDISGIIIISFFLVLVHILVSELECTLRVRKKNELPSAHRKPWLSMLGYPRYRNYPWIIRYG